jgi:hypothetical protein
LTTSNETAELMRTVPVKKTEILKVRVDKETHTALMRYCEGSKQSPSYVLRKVLGELIQEGNGSGNGAHGAVAGGSEGGREGRAQYAGSIAAILIAEHLSMTGRQQQQSPNRLREIARLVDALLQAICGDPGQEPAPASFPSEEMSGPALTVLPAEPAPKYG